MEDYLFVKRDLRALLEHALAKIKEEVQGLDRDYLLNVSETDLCDPIVAKYRGEAPVLRREEIYVQGHSEADVDISQDWNRAIFDRSRPAYIKGTSITVAVPFDGEATLFEYQPSTFSLNPPRGRVRGQELLLTYTSVDHNPEGLKQSYNRDLGQIESYLRSVQDQVRSHNESLPNFVCEVVAARKKKLLADAGLVSALGIPIRRRPDESGTYAPPEVRRKPPVRRPEVKTSHFTPEPALPDEEYDHILKIIESMVLVMERSPQAFAEMDEEALRTHILVQLNGHYEGQATGETFNHVGKTDILIRSEGKNVFIAECKFWKGAKQLLSTIDQLLSYTSWRDTKTAVLIFNRGREHTVVLQKVPEVVQQHPCFKRGLGDRGEAHFRYLFNQPGDKNREVIASVLVFSVPSASMSKGGGSP